MTDACKHNELRGEGSGGVPFYIPDVIFKSLQLSFLKAVRDKWLHMYLSGRKHAVECAFAFTGVFVYKRDSL